MRSIGSVIGSLFRRKTCPIPTGKKPRGALELRHVTPLVGFVVPTVVIGYGFVIPRSCIAGVNELTIGFATTIAGACVTYFLGVHAALAKSAE